MIRELERSLLGKKVAVKSAILLKLDNQREHENGLQGFDLQNQCKAASNYTPPLSLCWDFFLIFFLLFGDAGNEYKWGGEDFVDIQICKTWIPLDILCFIFILTILSLSSCNHVLILMYLIYECSWFFSLKYFWLILSKYVLWIWGGKVTSGKMHFLWCK